MKLENTLVNYYFEKICSIPHMSFHEKQISDYVVSIAKKYHHTYYQDDLWNVIVIKQACKGYEDHEPIMLQAHMDMVCNKTKDSNFDFLKDPLELKYDGKILRANGTTLGGDDGVGVAIMLALLSDDTFEHPRLECVFTVREETGCDGAALLDISMCKAHKFINLDGQGEVKVTVGNYCSDRIIIEKKLHPIEEKKNAYHLHIDEFDPFEFKKEYVKKEDHPLQYLFSLLNSYPYELISIKMGRAENMPPVEIDIDLWMEEENLKQLIAELNKEHRCIVNKIETSYYQPIAIKRIVSNLVEKIENGPILINEDSKMISSFLFGILNLDDKKLEIIGSTRCLNAKINDQEIKKLRKLAENNECELKNEVRYVSWPYDPNSNLKKQYQNCVKKYWNKDIQESICPGGLEVTDFLSKRNFDVLSIGVNAGDFHNTTEWLDIASLNNLYELLLHFLQEYN